MVVTERSPLGFLDFDALKPVAAAADIDQADDRTHLGIARHQVEAPARATAFEFDAIEALERRDVAAERRAYALDESPQHRIVLQPQGATLVAGSTF